MKNKAKLAFELLELEMEVIYKEDLMQFVGGSGGYGYSLSGGFSSNGYLNDPYFMNSQFWDGSCYSCGGYGGGYYVGPTYVAGTGSGSYTPAEWRL